MILTNYDGLESPIRHTKFRGKPSTGYGEEDFEVFFPYIGVAVLGHVTKIS